MAPMATGLAMEDGQPTERQIEYYCERARGGVGLIVTEGSAISPEGRSAKNRFGLYDEEHITAHKKLVEAIHSIGTPVCAQLHHAGAVAPTEVSGQYPLSCSSVPLFSRRGPLFDGIPRKLRETEVLDVITMFSRAAARARASGYDAVMVHAGHGYLVHQFLSPKRNNRQDKYGGTEKNRARFLIEVVASLKKTLGAAFPVMVRLPGDDRMNGGCTIQCIQRLSKWLENVGADEISISGGSKDEGEDKTFPSAAVREGFLAEDSRAIKDVVGIPVGLVGRIMSAHTAEMILKEAKADLIYLGRSLIADPYFVKKIGDSTHKDIRPCIVCNRCIDNLRRSARIKCSVNPRIGCEADSSSVRSAKSFSVLVVGGGPGGMEVARTAALRGHRVSLFEKSSALGGNLNKATLLPHKEQIAKLIAYYINELSYLKVEISLNTEVTRRLFDKFKPQITVLATGSVPIRPNIPGSALKNVFLAEDFLRDRSILGGTVAVVGGGMIGVEVADLLADMGKEVHLIEKLSSIAQGASLITRRDLAERLAKKGVRVFVNTNAVAFGSAGVLVEHAGNNKTINADNIILASGYRPNRSLCEHLDLLGTTFYTIGDCVQPRTILEAIEEGYLIGSAI